METNDRLHADVRNLREEVGEVKNLLERLVRLEERHANTANALERAFSALAKIDGRVRKLELAQPVQRLATGWVTNAAWAAAGVLAMLLLRKIGVV
ncbi:hypothetical protein ACLIIZ_03520 [Azonexus caeni]|jgi:multidrug resistance efflux pump|uniref:hypothetical protein n=1 Tax=Azonexus caeni TaxID=266126 RepID=UPI003A84B4B7